MVNIGDIGDVFLAAGCGGDPTKVRGGARNVAMLAALTAVIILHLVFGFAFYSELGARIRAKLDPSPLSLTPIQPPKEAVKPPTIVPFIDHQRIYVPPPDFPGLAAQSDSEVTADIAPSAPPTDILQSLPQPTSVRVPVRMDPKHPLKIGKDYYPDAAVRANEMGRCIVRATVAADGRIIAAAIETRSGFDADNPARQLRGISLHAGDHRFVFGQVRFADSPLAAD